MSGALASSQDYDCRYLLERVASREEQAFEALHRRYARFVLAIAFRLTGNPVDAEEVAQEVFLELWRRPPNAKEGSRSLEAWLVLVTRTRSWRMLRRKRAHVSLDASFEEDLTYSDPCFLHIFEMRLRAQVESAFTQVSGAQRDVLELTWFQGLGATQISRHLGLPLIAVRRHVQCVAFQLRRRLAA